MICSVTSQLLLVSNLLYTTTSCFFTGYKLYLWGIDEKWGFELVWMQDCARTHSGCQAVSSTVLMFWTKIAAQSRLFGLLACCEHTRVQGCSEDSWRLPNSIIDCHSLLNKSMMHRCQLHCSTMPWCISQRVFTEYAPLRLSFRTWFAAAGWDNLT